MTYRKHIPSHQHEGWSVSYPLLETLTEAEEADLARGVKFFREHHPNCLLFPEPEISLVQPKPAELRELVIVPGDVPRLLDWADRLAVEMQKTHGVMVSILRDANPKLLWSRDFPILLLGGSHENPLSMALAKTYQLGVFSPAVPGKNSWGGTTYHELEAGLPPCFVLSADQGQETPASQFFLKQVYLSNHQPHLGWFHHLAIAPEARVIPIFPEWLARECPPLLNAWKEKNFAPPYHRVFQETLEQPFPEGLPYTAPLVDLGLQGIRHYQLTGEPEGLELFREMLRGYWNYLNAPNPNIYVSDIDFRLGLICNYWNWIEKHPGITEEERIIVPKLLLGLTRMVHDYFLQNWRHKTRPHNHQTFKARSLILGWRYFQRAALPESAGWKVNADYIFEAVTENRGKFRENAGVYETFVPEHTLTWLEACHKPVTADRRKALAQFALREWATRDNFFNAVEYGDSEPDIRPNQPLTFGAWLEDSDPLQQMVREAEHAFADQFPYQLPSAVRSFTGMEPAYRPCSKPVFTEWTVVPMDRTFADAHALRGSPDEQFDKLVWRTGWKKTSTYLALEGIGQQQGEHAISHSHYEANTVLRLNMSGRIWLVNNGYGKDPRIVSAGQAFRTRQIGPDDHNTLLLRNRDGEGFVFPPGNARLVAYGTNPLPFSWTSLEDYGGFTWSRLMFFPTEEMTLIIDHVTGQTDRNISLELHWNLLGDLLQEGPTRCHFDQTGIRMTMASLHQVENHFAPSPVAVWKKLIETKAYPHTQAMPTSLRQIPVDQPRKNQPFQCTFVTLFSTNPLASPECRSVSKNVFEISQTSFPDLAPTATAFGEITAANKTLRISLALP